MALIWKICILLWMYCGMIRFCESCAPARNTTQTCRGENICYNGFCQERTVRTPFGSLQLGVCHCDQGWFGQHCERCCELPCQNGSCLVRSPNNTQFCLCEDGFEGPLCEKYSEKHTSLAPMPTLQTTEINTLSVRSSTEVPDSSTVQTRPPCAIKPEDQITLCMGRECFHGDCVVKERVHSAFGTIRIGTCQCWPGWRGIKCNMCCDLPCQNGNCIILATGKRVCACQPNFTSTLCDVAVPTEKTMQQTSPKLVVQRQSSTVSPEEPCNARNKGGYDECGIYSKCYNGDCVNTTYVFGLRNITLPRCECWTGWTGIQCNICCDLPCVNGTCARGFSNQKRCVCDTNFTGPLCAGKYDGRPNQGPINTCAGRPCLNGDCTSKQIRHPVYGNIPAYLCQCWPRWRGSACNMSCDMPCVHGICVVMSDQTRLCSCTANATGSLCENLVADHGTDTRWYWAVYAVGVFGVALLALLIIIPCCLRKRRTASITTKTISGNDNRTPDDFNGSKCDQQKSIIL